MFNSVVEESTLRTQIYQLVKWAVLHLTGDKSVPETFCANLADYVYQNAESFVEHYGAISRDTLIVWLTEHN